MTQNLAQAARAPEKPLPRLERKEELRLARRYHALEDHQAAERVLRAHVADVHREAARLRGYRVPMEDLISEGHLGLLHALRKFDPERGVRFSTYAAFWIRAYIIRYIISNRSLVSIGEGSRAAKRFFSLRRDHGRLMARLGDETQVFEELAKHTRLPEQELARTLARIDGRDTSLDASLHPEGPSMLELMRSPAEDPEHALCDKELQQARHELIHRLLEGLDQRERLIAQTRLMRSQGEREKLVDVGQRLGLSKERVRQLEERLKRKLRARLIKLWRASDGAILDLSSFIGSL